MGRTEREKMLAGELYRPQDDELRAIRLRARHLLWQYNQSPPEAADRRREILNGLLGTFGQGSEIEPPFQCDYGAHIHVGDRFFANFGCIILDVCEVRIGHDVMLAPNVQIYAATHPLDATLRVSGVELGRPVTIGNRVWIGGGAIVCPGVTIGHDAVIGAGSVVIRSIPAGVVAAGNPCRVIRGL